MSLDREWVAWEKDWRWPVGAAAQSQLLELRRRVRRETVKMILCLVVELVISVSILTLCFWHLWRRPGISSVILMVAVTVFVGVAQGFSIALKRGQWRPADQTSRSFLDLSRQRCHTTLKSLRFAWQLLAVEYLFIAAWGILHLRETPQQEVSVWRYIVAYGAVALFGVVMWFWTAWKRTRTLEELRTLEAIEREMEG